MMNFVRKHWRGEYSLPRSYWLHGSLLGVAIMIVGQFLIFETEQAKFSPYALPLGISCLVYILLIVVYGVWVTGGTWRSATRRGGGWARAAKVMIVFGWISSVGQIAEGLTPKQDHRVSANTPAPMTVEQQAASAADFMSKTPRSVLIDKMSVYIDKSYNNDTRSWGRIKDWAIKG